MSWVGIFRRCLMAVSLLVGAGAARASDPQPGDLVTPPANLNIALFYNEFSDTGQYAEADGTKLDNGTHLAQDIVVARYIRTFQVAGFNGGVQGYVPYVIIAGNLSLGLPNIPGPRPGAPSFGPGREELDAEGGFGQPNFSAFFYPVDDPATGTYAVISPWISPPIGNFDRDASINPGRHVWSYEIEDGVRTTLLGAPTGRNLSIELWDSLYFYGHDNKSALVEPAVDADAIPALYQSLGVTNPLTRPVAFPATYRVQPSNEVRVYLPFQIVPAMDAFIAPGIYQSFGGKVTYRLNNGATVTGARTNETQLRLVGSTFLSRQIAVLASADVDVRARGGPLNRTFVFRLVAFF